MNKKDINIKKPKNDKRVFQMVDIVSIREFVKPKENKVRAKRMIIPRKKG